MECEHSMRNHHDLVAQLNVTMDKNDGKQYSAFLGHQVMLILHTRHFTSIRLL